MADVNVEGRTRRAQLLRDMQDQYPTYQPPSFGGGQEDTKGPLGFIHTTLALLGLAPGAGIPFDLLDAGIYSLEALFAKDAESRKGSLIGAGLSGAAAVPFFGWGTRATQAGKALKKSSEEVIKLTEDANRIARKALEEEAKGITKNLKKHDEEFKNLVEKLIPKATKEFTKNLNLVDDAIKGAGGVSRTTKQAVSEAQGAISGMSAKKALRYRDEMSSILKDIEKGVPKDIKNFKSKVRNPAVKGVDQASKKLDAVRADPTQLPIPLRAPQEMIPSGPRRNVSDPQSISDRTAQVLTQRNRTRAANIRDTMHGTTQTTQLNRLPENINPGFRQTPAPRPDAVNAPRVEPPIPPSGGIGGVRGTAGTTPTPSPITGTRSGSGAPVPNISRPSGMSPGRQGSMLPTTSNPGPWRFSNPIVGAAGATAGTYSIYKGTDALITQQRENRANAAAEQSQQNRVDPYKNQPEILPKDPDDVFRQGQPKPEAQPETSRDDEESFADREQFRRQQQEVEAEDDGWISIGEGEGEGAGEGEKTAEEIEWRQKARNAEKAALRRREILKKRRAKGTGTPRGAGLDYLRDEDEVQNRIEQGQRSLRGNPTTMVWRNPNTKSRFHSGQPINTRRMNAALLRRSLQES
tara:strand:- start:23287 stop:25194 length:1908 start_codon:yes stop_codon:yes gene_type:complete